MDLKETTPKAAGRKKHFISKQITKSREYKSKIKLKK